MGALSCSSPRLRPACGPVTSEPPVPEPPSLPGMGQATPLPLFPPPEVRRSHSLFRRRPAGHLSLSAVRAQWPLRVCLGLGDPLSLSPLCPYVMPSSILAHGKVREPQGRSRGGLLTRFVSVCRWLWSSCFRVCTKKSEQSGKLRDELDAYRRGSQAGGCSHPRGRCRRGGRKGRRPSHLESSACPPGRPGLPWRLLAEHCKHLL